MTSAPHCLVCQATAASDVVEAAVTAVLVCVLSEDYDHAAIRRGTCFVHRRRVDVAVTELRRRKVAR